ncbi:MAG TPA: hypothetical protein GX707_06405 [Epulopiscium sp.]|nr:hypothetical protein [Candidatus Epulonipiscium sp.]
MKNTLGDLNTYLFEQLDVLSNQDLKGERLKEEMKRAKAITEIGKGIVSNGNLVLQAKKFTDAKLDEKLKLPGMLEG